MNICSLVNEAHQKDIVPLFSPPAGEAGIEIQLKSLHIIFYSTLLVYSPVSVLTSIVSPSSTKRGTETWAPVSRVTILVPPWALSPLTPGGASVTFNEVLIGKDTLTTFSLKMIASTILFGFKKLA